MVKSLALGLSYATSPNKMCLYSCIYRVRNFFLFKYLPLVRRLVRNNQTFDKIDFGFGYSKIS